MFLRAVVKWTTQRPGPWIEHPVISAEDALTAVPARRDQHVAVPPSGRKTPDAGENLREGLTRQQVMHTVNNSAYASFSPEFTGMEPDPARDG